VRNSARRQSAPIFRRGCHSVRHPPVEVPCSPCHPLIRDKEHVPRSAILLLTRSFVILTGLIKVLTSDNESTTSRAFCLHARWRFGSRASRQDQEVTSQAPEETSFCLQTVYLQPTLRAFYQFRSGFQPTRRRNFGLTMIVSCVSAAHRPGWVL